MKQLFLCTLFASAFLVVTFTKCGSKASQEEPSHSESLKTSFNGYESQEKWGEHLVIIGGCNDCHTPKKMTANGPVPDDNLLLSGHPAQMPAPDVNRREMESKGLAVSNTLTSWVGPWGISYASNLTSDATGLGDWDESRFFIAIRQGKAKGLASARPMLPPMPWQGIGQMTDDELKAVFAYLKSTKPVKNIVPANQPPVSAPR
jgi:hypothetical protein